MNEEKEQETRLTEHGDFLLSLKQHPLTGPRPEENQ